MFLCCKHMLHKVINSPRTGASTDSMTIRPWKLNIWCWFPQKKKKRISNYLSWRESPCENCTFDSELEGRYCNLVECVYLYSTVFVFPPLEKQTLGEEKRRELQFQWSGVEWRCQCVTCTTSLRSGTPEMLAAVKSTSLASSSSTDFQGSPKALVSFSVLVITCLPWMLHFHIFFFE